MPVGPKPTTTNSRVDQSVVVASTQTNSFIPMRVDIGYHYRQISNTFRLRVLDQDTLPILTVDLAIMVLADTQARPTPVPVVVIMIAITADRIMDIRRTTMSIVRMRMAQLTRTKKIFTLGAFRKRPIMDLTQVVVKVEPLVVELPVAVLLAVVPMLKVGAPKVGHLMLAQLVVVVLPHLVEPLRVELQVDLLLVVVVRLLLMEPLAVGMLTPVTLVSMAHRLKKVVLAANLLMRMLRSTSFLVGDLLVLELLSLRVHPYMTLPMKTLLLVLVHPAVQPRSRAPLVPGPKNVTVAGDDAEL